jgi:hypothetical protein
MKAMESSGIIKKGEEWMVGEEGSAICGPSYPELRRFRYM